MLYKGYEIKEEVLDWLIAVATNTGSPFNKESNCNDIHEVKRIGNNIAFRQTINECNISNPDQRAPKVAKQ